MSEYKVGDRFRSKTFPVLTAEIVHIVDLGSHASYGVIVTSPKYSQEYYAVDREFFHGNWKPLPKFFEAGKKYGYKNRHHLMGITYEVVTVTEYGTYENPQPMAFALARSDGRSTPCNLFLDDFDEMFEVED